MKYLRILFMAFLASMIAACGGGGDSTSTTSAKGTLSVQMTDAPATPDYLNLWVTVEKVRVHMSETDDPNAEGWQEIVLDPPRKIELLELRNGFLADLGQIEVPAGQYHQFRLVLSSQPGANQLELASNPGNPVDLVVPSAGKSGLKLNAKPFVVEEGQTVELVVDVDAARSIKVHKAGKSANEKYILRPVVRVIPVLDAGKVAGSFVDPVAAADASVSLQAYNSATGEVTVLRSTTPANGNWMLAPVDEGTAYNLVIAKPGYRTIVMTNVAVVAGEIAQIDPIELTPVAADDSTKRVAAGGVAPAEAALVRALQKVKGDPITMAESDVVVEVAFANAFADTGEFGFHLNVEPALVGDPGSVLNDGDNPGVFTFAAVGDAGTGEVPNVDLNPGDVLDLSIVLAP